MNKWDKKRQTHRQQTIVWWLPEEKERGEESRR